VADADQARRSRRAIRLDPQAAFIGVAAMVGVFSLLGAAGELAGAAVWISFLVGTSA
jgi:hypothetical protein